MLESSKDIRGHSRSSQLPSRGPGRRRRRRGPRQRLARRPPGPAQPLRWPPPRRDRTTARHQRHRDRRPLAPHSRDGQGPANHRRHQAPRPDPRPLPQALAHQQRPALPQLRTTQDVTEAFRDILADAAVDEPSHALRGHLFHKLEKLPDVPSAYAMAYLGVFGGRPDLLPDGWDEEIATALDAIFDVLATESTVQSPEATGPELPAE